MGYGTEGRIAIAGGSAGGQLMGAVVNQAPELWGAVAAHVPFVDVLNTILDDTLPLTPIEWPEWGNPIEDRTVFDYIRSYSPYDQLKRRKYPPMLVTAGLNDPRVTYWEPAKYVAKLRSIENGRQPAVAEDQHGRGPRRQVRQVRPPLRSGRRVRVHPGQHGGAGVTAGRGFRRGGGGGWWKESRIGGSFNQWTLTALKGWNLVGQGCTVLQIYELAVAL